MELDAQIAKSVEDNGWHAISIEDADPPFFYACGLPTSFNHPELIVFGLDPKSAYGILSAVIEDIMNEKSFKEPGKIQGILEEATIAVRPVHPTHYEFYVGYAMGHHRHVKNPGDLAVMQIFWPDETGHFPFDRECDNAVYQLQPRLDQPLTPGDVAEMRASRGVND